MARGRRHAGVVAFMMSDPSVAAALEAERAEAERAAAFHYT